MARHRTPDARNRIIEEAEHLLHLRGYEGTSLDDIAGRCRMTKANLLHHFRSKEDLGLAVLDYKIEATRRDCLDCCFAPDADPFEGVRALFGSAARFQRANGCKAGCFIANMALEMADKNDRFREKAGAFFEEWASRIARNLERNRDAGLLGPSLDPRSAAESILALYEGAVMLARTRRDCGVLDRAGRTAAALLEAHRRATDSRRRPAVPARHEDSVPKKTGIPPVGISSRR